MAESADIATIYRMRRRHWSGWEVLAVAAIVVFLGFLIVPLASLFIQVPLSELLRRLRSPVVLDALRLSLVTSMASVSTVIILGLPLAFFLATRHFKGKRLLEVLINLPMVLPPTVAGLGLLLAFGRSGTVGRMLLVFGITVPFSTLAVILAQIFVAAPFFVNTARAGFESIETKYLQAAATLRATPVYSFFHVVLPLSLPALLTATAMCWARALGEFGATITFAGNMPGITQTMPLAVYMALQSDLSAAITLSVILLIVSFGLLFFLRGLEIYRKPR